MTYMPGGITRMILIFKTSRYLLTRPLPPPDTLRRLLSPPPVFFAAPPPPLSDSPDEMRPGLRGPASRRRPRPQRLAGHPPPLRGRQPRQRADAALPGRVCTGDAHPRFRVDPPRGRGRGRGSGCRRGRGGPRCPPVAGDEARCRAARGGPGVHARDACSAAPGGDRRRRKQAAAG